MLEENGLSESSLGYLICLRWMALHYVGIGSQALAGQSKAHTLLIRNRSVKIVNIRSIPPSCTQTGIILIPKVPIFAVLQFFQENSQHKATYCSILHSLTAMG